MSIDLIPNDNPHFPLWIFYTIVGATGIIAGLTPVILKEYLWINEVFLATAVGIIFGASGAIPSPLNWPGFFPILQEAARVFLAIQVYFKSNVSND